MVKHCCKSEKGIITIFVTVMMFSVLSLGTLVLELGRLAAAKMQLSDATVSAATSMVAGYNINLYGRFGVLSMDTRKATEARCRDYLEFNSDLNPTYYGSGTTRLYALENVEMKGIYNLTLPNLLRRQIMTQAKYNVVPENFALNAYNAEWILSDLQNECGQVAEAMEEIISAGRSGNADDFDEEAEELITALRDTFGTPDKSSTDCNAVIPSGSMGQLPSRTGVVADALPVDDSAMMSTLLGDAYSVLGGQAAGLTRTASTAPGMADASVNVDMVEALDELNAVDWTSDGAVHALAGQLAEDAAHLANGVDTALSIVRGELDDNLLLNSYAATVFSDRNNLVVNHSGPGYGSGFSGAEANFVSASLEYLFEGDASEMANQEAAWNNLFALRYLNNLSVLLEQGGFADKADDYNVLMNFAWAYYETCADMRILADANNEIPLFKGGMYIPFTDKDRMNEAFGGSFEDAMQTLGVYNGTDFEVGGSEPFTYRNGLSLALCLVPNNTKLARMADLMQLEMRYRQSYLIGETPDFLMQTQNTYCRVRASAKLNSILPVIALSGNGNVGALRFSSIKYVGY